LFDELFTGSTLGFDVSDFVHLTNLAVSWFYGWHF
jgi:hypothetical protein